MKIFFKFKKGIVSIVVILIVLLASSAIVIYQIRNQIKSKAVDTSSTATAVKTYQYLVRVANTNINAPTAESNPSIITSDGSKNFTFTLRTTPDQRGYTAFVCSPDCSIISGGLDPGLSRYNVLFTPHLQAGKLLMNPQGPVNLNVDQDRDGFTYGMELYHGTDPIDNCSNSTNVFAWPVDLNNDKYVTIQDMLAVSRNIGVTGGIGARYDLKPDSIIDSADVQIVASYFGKSCTN